MILNKLWLQSCIPMQATGIPALRRHEILQTGMKSPVRNRTRQDVRPRMCYP